MSHRVEITLREDVLGRLDEARGHEPRASFVKRALESALGCSDVIAGAGPVERAPGPGHSAPSRMPSHPLTERELQAIRDIAESSGVPEPVPGCPECSGDMAPRDGRWVCGDCGFTR